MSFMDNFESKQPGIDDTIEWILRVAVATLAAVILVVVTAMVAGLFVDNSVISNDKIFEMITPAFNTVIGAFVGLLGGLSVNRAKDGGNEAPSPQEPESPSGFSEAPTPTDPAPLAPAAVETSVAPAPQAAAEPAAAAAVEEEDHHDDEMAPWERYRNDLRYDANGDGVVDENDFPDWRSAGQ